MTDTLENFLVVVERASQPTPWNSSPLRFLNWIRRRNGSLVTVYERGLTFPRYREHMRARSEAEVRADQLRAILAATCAVPRQPVWRRL